LFPTISCRAYGSVFAAINIDFPPPFRPDDNCPEMRHQSDTLGEDAPPRFACLNLHISALIRTGNG
jgi:hypothetical protein